jgi:long-chain acyl-CoA synthetase
MTSGLTARTLPGLLLERARLSPKVIAMRHHDLGIWAETTWSALAVNVRDAGNGLASLGVGIGDAVGLVAVNQPAWVHADLAIQGLGGITVAIDPEFSAAATATLLTSRPVTVVIVGDQQQFDKVAEIAGLLPASVRIVVIDTRALRHLDRGMADDVVGSNALTLTWAQVVEAGRRTLGGWDESVAVLDDAAVVTVEGHVETDEAGLPRLRVHPATSRELLASADDLGGRLGAHTGDELYPVASFADPVERSLSIGVALRFGAVVNVGEGGELATLESRSVQPTIAHVPAVRLQRMRADIEQRRATRGLRKFAVDRAIGDSSSRSASSKLDLLVTYALLAAWLVAAAVIHRAMVDRSGVLRLAIIGAIGLLVGGVLIGRGHAVRPFIRKAYGLSRAHSLLTGPEIDSATIRLLGSLHLEPILERRTVGGPLLPGSEASDRQRRTT